MPTLAELSALSSPVASMEQEKDALASATLANARRNPFLSTLAGTLQGTIGGGSLTALGNVTGALGLKQASDALYAKGSQLQADAAPYMAPQLDYRTVNDAGSAWDFAKANMAQGVGSMAPILAGRALGGMPLGLAAGYLPQHGEMVDRVKSDAAISGMSEQALLGVAAPTAAVQTALDYIVPGGVATKLARKGATALGTGAAGRAGATLGTNMLLEGGTELAQEEIGMGVHGLLNPNRDTSEDTHARIQSFLGGAFGGAPMGAIDAGVGYLQDKLDARPPKPLNIAKESKDILESRKPLHPNLTDTEMAQAITQRDVEESARATELAQRIVSAEKAPEQSKKLAESFLAGDKSGPAAENFLRDVGNSDEIATWFEKGVAMGEAVRKRLGSAYFDEKGGGQTRDYPPHHLKWQSELFDDRGEPLLRPDSYEPINEGRIESLSRALKWQDLKKPVQHDEATTEAIIDNLLLYFRSSDIRKREAAKAEAAMQIRDIAEPLNAWFASNFGADFNDGEVLVIPEMFALSDKLDAFVQTMYSNKVRRGEPVPPKEMLDKAVAEIRSMREAPELEHQKAFVDEDGGEVKGDDIGSDPINPNTISGTPDKYIGRSDKAEVPFLQARDSHVKELEARLKGLRADGIRSGVVGAWQRLKNTYPSDEVELYKAEEALIAKYKDAGFLSNISEAFLERLSPQARRESLLKAIDDEVKFIEVEKESAPEGAVSGKELRSRRWEITVKNREGQWFGSPKDGVVWFKRASDGTEFPTSVARLIALGRRNQQIDETGGVEGQKRALMAGITSVLSAQERDGSNAVMGWGFKRGENQSTHWMGKGTELPKSLKLPSGMFGEKAFTPKAQGAFDKYDSKAKALDKARKEGDPVKIKRAEEELAVQARELKTNQIISNKAEELLDRVERMGYTEEGKEVWGNLKELQKFITQGDEEGVWRYRMLLQESINDLYDFIDRVGVEREREREVSSNKDNEPKLSIEQDRANPNKKIERNLYPVKDQETGGVRFEGDGSEAIPNKSGSLVVGKLDNPAQEAKLIKAGSAKQLRALMDKYADDKTSDHYKAIQEAYQAALRKEFQEAKQPATLEGKLRRYAELLQEHGVEWVAGAVQKLDTAKYGSAYRLLKQLAGIDKNDPLWGSESWRESELDRQKASKDALEALNRLDKPSERRLGNAQTPSSKTLNIWHSSGENAALSNLASRPFSDTNGTKYFSVEHAYQSWKSGKFDGATHKKYTKADQKIVGNLGTKTENDWNIKLMAALIRRSFEQNPDAMKILKATGDAVLTHTQDNGVWAKEFPRILMELRDLGISAGVNVVEHPVFGYRDRTLHNAKADATMALAVDFTTAGERMTAKAAGKKLVQQPLVATSSVIAEAVVAHMKKLGAKSLNVAGNGIYTLAEKGITQEQVNDQVYKVLYRVHKAVGVDKIVTGGQTGVDIAGAIAARKLGIPVEVTMPKGFLQRDSSGKDSRHTQAEIMKQIEDGAKALKTIVPGEVAKAKVETPRRLESKVEPMLYAMPASDNIWKKSTTTFDQIVSGERTSTTRGKWMNGLPKVGREIIFRDSKGRTVKVVVTKVTKVPEKVHKDSEFAKQWVQKEGWTYEAAERNGYFKGHQVEFELADKPSERRLGNAMAADIHKDLGKEGFAATHDSPIRHEGKFDWRKHTGKGEGNAAFGAGTYLSTSEGVHKSYKNQFTAISQQQSQAKLTSANREYLRKKEAADGALAQMKLAQKYPGNDFYKARYDQFKYGYDLNTKWLKDHAKDAPKSTYAADKSPTYEVTVNAKPEELLDWDAPLSEQSDLVKKARSRALEELNFNQFDRSIAAGKYTDGADFYNAVTGSLGSQAKASDYLQSLGIVGHRYAASGGRNNKFPNYVVYDDSRIETNYIHFNAQSQSESAETPVTDKTLTEDEKKEIREAVTKRLGEMVLKLSKALFGTVNGEQVPLSADWGPGSIRIAANIGFKSAMQAAMHESMHEFFHRLSQEPAGKELLAKLVKAANSAPVVRQLERLLQDHPNAVMQIEEGQPDYENERLAYMYQFWQAGMLELGPETKTVFQKIMNYLRELVKLLSNDQQAELILQAFDRGDFAKNDQLSVVAQVVQKSTEGRHATLKAAKALAEGPLGRLKKVVVTAHATLHDSGYEELRDIANFFWLKPGERNANGSQGMHEARKQKASEYMNKLNRILGTLAEKDFEAVRDALMREDGKAPKDMVQHKAYTELRAMLDEVHTYVDKAGVMRLVESMDPHARKEWEKIPMRKFYYPQIWDVIGKEGEFVADLMKYHQREIMEQLKALGFEDYKESKRHLEYAQALASRLVNTQGDPDVGESGLDIGFSPIMSAINKRKIDWITAPEMMKYRNQDLRGTLTSYIMQAVKRAEYVRQAGNAGVEIKTRMNEAHTKMFEKELWKAGAVDADKLARKAKGTWKDEYLSWKTGGVMNRKDAKEYKPADYGVTAKQIADARAAADKEIAKYHSAVMAMEGTIGHDISPTLRKMSGAMMVYQNFRLLIPTLFASTSDPMGIMINGGEVDDAYDALKRGLKGVYKTWTQDHSIDDATKLAEDMGWVDAGSFMETIGQTYSSVYMGGNVRKLNDGLFKWNGMEAWNRGMRVGASIAAQKFIIKHMNEPGQHSKRWLDELFGPDYRPTLKEDGTLDVTDPKVSQAVMRWIDGAILAPNAAHRPPWASDPHWALLFHMKQFTYSFHKVILQKAWNEAMTHGNAGPLLVLVAGYTPMVLVGETLRGIIMSGGEEPYWMQKGVGSTLWHGIDRANFAGIPQIGLDTVGRIAKSEDNLFSATLEGGASLAGPTTSWSKDWYDKPLGEQMLRSLPLGSTWAKFAD